MASPTLTVALTGATGFVGRHFLPQLLRRGHRVRALVRDPQRLPHDDAKVQPVRGDLAEEAALAELTRGADAVVHLVGIIRELPERGQTFDALHRAGTDRLLHAARTAGIRRWVHMSALGARAAAVSEYHQSKWRAEEAVRHSGMAWTIFRPSIIHGPDGEFVQLLKGLWSKRFPPFVPFFGANAGLRDARETLTALLWPFPSLRRAQGSIRYISAARAGLLQPVWVEDVASCFAEALTLDRTAGEVYPMGGPDAYTWPQLYALVRDHFPAARNKNIVAIPAWYAKLIAGLPGAPFNRDQVIMSQEDSTCQTGKVERDFDFQLAPFEPILAEYAARIV